MTKDSNHVANIDLVIDIKITTDNEKEYIHKSQSLSNHGVIVEHNMENEELSIGNTVILQVCGDLGNEAPFPVKSEVIDITDNGVEFRFIL